MSDKPTIKKSTKIMGVIIIAVFAIGLVLGALNIFAGGGSSPQQDYQNSSTPSPF